MVGISSSCNDLPLASWIPSLMMNNSLTFKDRLQSLSGRLLYWNVLSRARARFAERGLCLTEWERSILSVRNRHRGKVAFLIGNGPSVQCGDLEAIKGNVAFCANRFYLAYPRMDFRPNYLVSGDQQVIDDFGQEIIDKAECEVWFFGRKRPRLKGLFGWCRSFGRSPFQMQRNALFGLNTGGSTMIMALQLARWMGIHRIYLYGIDHSFNFTVERDATDRFRSARGDNNHFISNYRSGKLWCPPAKEFIEEGFSACDKALRAEGGFVMNATRGGCLDVVERCPLEDALREAKARV